MGNTRKIELEEILYQKGITLIALIITIVVMLILAGVTINLTIGENGIFSAAVEAREKQKISAYKEKVELARGTVALYNMGEVTLEKLIEEIYNQKIVPHGSIIIQEDGKTAVMTTEEGYIFEITVDSIQYVSKGEIQTPPLDETNPTVTVEVRSINDKKVEITIKGQDNETGIKSYSLYVGEELVDTVVTNKEEIKIEVETSFGIKKCYVIAEDNAGNSVKSEEKEIEDNTIRTTEEMIAFRDSVNNGNTYEGKTIEMLNDIDLQGSATNKWTPIGNTEKVFAGTFDGKNNVINNIYIDTTNSYQGLFGYNTGTIKNVGIKTGTIKVGSISGALVGYSLGQIEKCYNNVDIHVYEGGNSGGLVGIIEQGAKISKCYNTGNIEGNITVTYETISGVVAWVNNSTIEYSYNTGDISVTTEANNTRACGVAGANNSIIKSCYNVGNISLVTNESVYPVSAGINAQMHNSKMYDCYNIGITTIQPTPTGPARNGGLTGYFDSDCVMENCYWLSTVSPVGVADCPGGAEEGNYEAIQIDKEEEMKNISSRLGSDFKEDTNNINNGFPILAWQDEE